jgi:manganese transport protein
VRIAAWVIALVIVSLNIKLVMNEVTGWLTDAGDQAWIIWITVVPICISALGLLLYITLKPWIEKRAAEREARIPHGTAIQLENLDKPIYQRIAICIDFTNIDALAIRSAIAQGGLQARYVLFHVVETAGAMVYGSDIADMESAEDAAALNKYRDQIAQLGYEIDIRIGYGNPKRIIPKMVKEFNSDLLVMGAHGHQFFKDLIFGTTLDAVRHRIDIPVLIVRDK